MQPTYLPWAGYFNLIAQVDKFVFLDDAQYERGSWQNRNRVLVQGEPSWLTIPVVRHFLGATLDAVHTDEKQPWRHKHCALLQQSYGRHPHGKEMLEVVRPLAEAAPDALAALNIALIGDICARLGLQTPTVLASALKVPGGRSERLIRILRALDCDEYLSPAGAAGYLREDRFEEQTEIRLRLHDYVPPPYPQRGTERFVSHLSIVDVVANLGWAESARYVRGA
jgi:hypothetical protein